MKKLTAIFLAFCMLFCMNSNSVFASETATDPKQVEEVTPSVARNRDLWSTGGTRQCVIEQFWIYPTTGENVKIHLYMVSGTVTGYIGRTPSEALNSGARFKWSTSGHHWADLVTATTNSGYYVILDGTFTANGGIYTEP